jgi:hypothetical protein
VEGISRFCQQGGSRASSKSLCLQIGFTLAETSTGFGSGLQKDLYKISITSELNLKAAMHCIRIGYSRAPLIYIIKLIPCVCNNVVGTLNLASTLHPWF